jgi:2-polyprenyl-3-methyl-5-hydroxy-6-metoxy-1,4-benzoquinol methylase
VTHDEPGRSGGIDWAAAYTDDVPETPVDGDVMAVADGRQPGSALDLGCGAGQNSIWLASKGWRVRGLDIANGAIERARAAAAAASLDATFEKADVTSWRTRERYDLVISTYALPPRGPGRRHALTTAVDAVAPRGTLLIAEFEMALAANGFELERAEVKVASHHHGSESQELPIVLVVARHPGPLSERA